MAAWLLLNLLLHAILSQPTVSKLSFSTIVLQGSATTWKYIHAELGIPSNLSRQQSHGPVNYSEISPNCIVSHVDEWKDTDGNAKIQLGP